MRTLLTYFFGFPTARFPSKIFSMMVQKASSENFKSYSAKNGCHDYYRREELFGGQGMESLRGEGILMKIDVR